MVANELTVTLKGGVVVLADPYLNGIKAAAYDNRSQALTRVTKLSARGVTARVWKSPHSRLFFVRLDADRDFGGEG